MTKTGKTVSFGLEEKNILLVCLLPVDVSARWFLSCLVVPCNLNEPSLVTYSHKKWNDDDDEDDDDEDDGDDNNNNILKAKQNVLKLSSKHNSYKY